MDDLSSLATSGRTSPPASAEDAPPSTIAVSTHSRLHTVRRLGGLPEWERKVVLERSSTP